MQPYGCISVFEGIFHLLEVEKQNVSSHARLKLLITRTSDNEN